MLPHERSLVKDLAGKPFTILFVDSDGEADKVRPLAERDGVTWRMFLDGSTSGPIATRWNVEGWPTIYVLDHEGVIRHRGLRGEELEDAIRKLVAKVPRAK
jgi:hypothetical protein